MKTVPVANTLLQLAFRDRSEDVSHPKLHALLYVFNGWHLAVRGVPAIDEAFEAWPGGPVLPSLFQRLARHEGEPLSNYVLEWDEKRQKAVPRVVSVAKEDFWGVLLRVWDTHGRLTLEQLVSIVRQPGSPWDKTNKMAPIDSELTRRHFVSLATDPQPAA